MRTLFISDLDGTLLGSDSRISDESRRMLNAAIGRGAMFSIVTARTPGTVADITAGLDLRMPAVVMTGAAMWDRNTGQYTDVQYFRREALDFVRAAYARHGAPAFCYTLRDGMIEIYHIGPLNEPERHFMEERRHNPYKRFLVNEDGSSDIPDTLDDAVLFFGIQPTGMARRVLEDIRDYPLVTPMFYHDIYGPEWAEMEAFADTASKAQAVSRLARRVEADRLVVIGDNLNDISMMQVADSAVAVGNAVDEVKEIADVVIGPNTADAVARYIYENS